MVLHAKDGCERTDEMASGVLPQSQVHEDAEPIVFVVAKGSALPEAGAAIQRLRRFECVVISGFEEQLPIAALTGLLKEVVEQRSPRSLPAKARWCAHRLHLAL